MGKGKKKKITKEIRKYLEINENITKNVWDATKAVQCGKCTIVNGHIKKKKKVSNQSSFTSYIEIQKSI